eukprot:scaffold116100_cov55-Phaeocystis_antarctica.AAC.2
MAVLGGAVLGCKRCCPAATVAADSSGAAAPTYPAALALTLGRCAAKLQPGRPTPHAYSRDPNPIGQPPMPTLETLTLTLTLVLTQRGSSSRLSSMLKPQRWGNTVLNNGAGRRWPWHAGGLAYIQSRPLISPRTSHCSWGR